MNGFVVYVAFQIVFAVIIIILSVLFWDKRYKKRKSGGIPAGFIRTEEVSLDPETNRMIRVYYHPETGERIYIPE